jgi:hypothetical protein
MIYNSVPTFNELMVFAAQFEKEFNKWVEGFRGLRVERFKGVEV